MFQDEARWTHQRQAMLVAEKDVGKQIIREYTYAYGAVSLHGAADFLILPVMHEGVPRFGMTANTSS